MAIVLKIEKHDTVVAKDGRRLRVLSVRRNGDQIQWVEGVDDTLESPMRSTVFRGDIVSVIPQGQKPAPEYVPDSTDPDDRPGVKK